MGIGIPKDYFQSTSKPHIVTDIELDESVNAIHDIEDDILAKMNGTTGHSHTGADGQGPNITEANVVFHDSTGHTHTETSNDGTKVPWAGLNSGIKSDDNPEDVATTPAPGTATKFSRSDHVHDHVAALGEDLHHPKTHATTHSLAGADEVNHDNLAGISSEDHHPTLHEATHRSGGGDALSHDNLVGVSSEDHHPTLHEVSHRSGGGDPLSHDNLGGVSIDDHHAKIHAAQHHNGGNDLMSHNSIPGGTVGNPHSGSAPSAHSHLDGEVDNGITLTNITQISNRSHTSLSSIGSNSHVTIDSHISSSSGHTYVGQDLRTSASPTFASITANIRVNADEIKSPSYARTVEILNVSSGVDFVFRGTNDYAFAFDIWGTGSTNMGIGIVSSASNTKRHKYGHCGRDDWAWSHMYAYSAYDDNGILGSFDEHDDLALIDAIKPLFDAEMEEEEYEEEEKGKKVKVRRPKRDLDGKFRYKLDDKGERKYKFDGDGNKVIRRDQQGNAIIDPETLPVFLNKGGFSKISNLSTFALGGIKKLHQKFKDQEQLIAQYGEEIRVLKERLDVIN